MLRDCPHDRKEDDEQNRDAECSADPKRNRLSRLPPSGLAVEWHATGWLSDDCRLRRYVAFCAGGGGGYRVLVIERSLEVSSRRNLFNTSGTPQPWRSSIS